MNIYSVCARIYQCVCERERKRKKRVFCNNMFKKLQVNEFLSLTIFQVVYVFSSLLTNTAKVTFLLFICIFV